MARDRSYVLLLLCFYLSGLAALIYETAWTREFAFVFGTSELAVATVLAAYMAGLAAGAAVAGRVAHRITRPVLAYGLLELGIALAALAVPFGIAGARFLYVAIFGGQEGLPDAGGLTTSLFYLACSFLILLVPTAMMGATLPLLARHAVREDREIGGRIGFLYAVNTAGAVSGVVLGAFVLLPALGLRATIVSAAAINALVFVFAWALARGAPAQAAAPAPERSRASADGAARWILPLIAASGFVSFTYEVLWVRLVGHVVGSGTHAFATMLASFLLGIALGAAVASRLATSPRRAATGFTVAQLGIAALSLAAFAVVNAIPGLTETLRDRGVAKVWADTAACALTLFPAALCIGATFPFGVRILARSREDAGAASARVYAANTAGCIAGSICAGFFLVPGLGFAGAILFAAVANLSLAVLAALLFRPRRPVLAGLAAAGLVAAAFFPPSTPWQMLRATSMGRGIGAWGPVEYMAVGRSSTVLVTDNRTTFSLRNSGLPEAGMPKDSKHILRHTLTRWLTALPVLARPESRSLLLVGFGGGMTLEVVPDSIERIDVIELEPRVIEANQSIADRRWRDPLSDPRVHVHVNDARNAMLLTETRFDAIVSQPSHPWAGGAAHLYTREFFELASRRLAPGGVFVQWIGLPFVDEELLRSLFATLGDVFPHVRAYSPPPDGSVLFLASSEPFDMDASVARALEQHPDDFALLGLRAVEDVTASLMLDEEGARAIAEGAPINRDGHNRLQSRSGRLEGFGLMREADALITPFDPLVGGLPEDDRVFFLLRRLAPERAERVAEALEDPIARSVGLALAEMSLNKPFGAQRRLREVLETEPTHTEARAALLRLQAGRIAQGLDPTTVVTAPLSEAERTMCDGWVARAEDPSGAALLALEDRLAAIPPRHPLAIEAARLRIQARLRSGDPERIEEAVVLAEDGLGDRPAPASILLRAEAAAAAGDAGLALDVLNELAPLLDVSRGSDQALWRRAREIASELQVEPDLARFHARVLQRLRARPGRRAPVAGMAPAEPS